MRLVRMRTRPSYEVWVNADAVCWLQELDANTTMLTFGDNDVSLDVVGNAAELAHQLDPEHTGAPAAIDTGEYPIAES